MTDDKLVAPASADSPEAEEAMVEDQGETVEGVTRDVNDMLSGYTPVIPKVYQFNTDNIFTIEDVKEALNTLNIEAVIFPGDNRDFDSKFWKELSEKEVVSLMKDTDSDDKE